MVPFGTINYYFLLLLSKAKKKILTDINTMISNLVFFYQIKHQINSQENMNLGTLFPKIKEYNNAIIQ